ncbi:hypothetical protein J3R82DRAFT_223 [Butyriboletus roseoflavus]|nr:hypothetical protein J3R82DRAFT_223 [Butyriboletus roseoflavus]
MSTTSSVEFTQSSHDTPSAHLNESIVAKEVRAHEHARHRTKERKEKAAAVRVLPVGFKVTHGTKLVRKLSMESWDGEEPKDQRPAPAAPPRDNTSSFTKLTLGDLISKPRRSKPKQFDFEVIPPIRAVIALDDVEADEPWEYITRASVNDGSAWRGKSYAQAVSAM